MTHPTPRRATDRLVGGARSLWRGWGRPLLVAALLVGSFRSALADWNDVPTGSMRPTILEGDRILVARAAYDLRVPFTSLSLVRTGDPARGDVVVLSSPRDGTRLVKRIVGVPGDTVLLRGNQLYLNGAPVIHATPWRGPLPGISAADLATHAVLAESLPASHPVMLDRRGPSPWSDFGPLAVPDGCYFVMGDNRDDSLDSRWFGVVPRRGIAGRAVAVAASLDPDHHYRPRWQRWLTRLR